MKNGKMQAKDLDDRLVLETVHRLAMKEREGGWGSPPFWVMAWDLEKELGLEDTGRLLMAKCDSLIKRKLLDGCTCGCRGDFELTRAGEEFLRTPQATSTQEKEK